ncbi:hypothetical protein GWI33_014693 [Rhynchophorus ferrugineus]|uniref:Uncharacterized protein n=1 Tax=Rhynchophorus ferrugineus TaxID=354439 RepID=A0A834M6N3_RHYFE|nr:hypothetical protein GWI33_014693 [Rhynchophorus ferrugineus]
MTGLEQFEIPVVGTYVDPRIIPGFCYKVRPNNRKNHLFNGRALRLQSVGMGYAKRLTFEPDNAINANNYLWSDNHPDGLGLEPRAVNVGMKFIVKAGEQILGEATVFRDDKPQFEENTEKIELSRPGGGSSEEDSYLMRVSGVAIVRKDPKSNIARVVEVFNIGLDSQLNILFAQTHMEIKFIPK